MLLSELNFFKTQDVSFHTALQQLIDKKGLSKAEGGQGTVIWNENKNYVWKFWFKDAEYERFIKYVEAHKGNKHLPKFLSKVRTEAISFKKMPKDMVCNYVKLEKLTPLEPSTFSDALDCLNNANWQPSQVPKTINELIDSLNPKMIPNHSDAELDEITDAIRKNKEFFELCLDLMKAGANDLHSDNVMMRGSVPVVIDPYK